MSAGKIRRRVLAILAEKISDRLLEEHLVLVLDDLPDSYLQFIYEVSLPDELGEQVALDRAAAVAFQHAAVEFADDVSDGDCPQEIDALVQAPVVLAALQSLFLFSAVRGGVSPQALGKSSSCFCAMASAQYVEVRTKRWSAAAARETAARLNGDQFSAFFSLLWEGTSHFALAEKEGGDFGFALHLMGDKEGRDERFSTVPEAERAKLMDEVKAALGRLRKSKVEAISRTARAVASSNS